MVNLFFMIPVFVLTNMLYVNKYGNYSIVEISTTSIVKSLFETHTWYSIITFSLILCISHIIESFLLPAITYRKSKSPIKDIDIEIKKAVYGWCNYYFNIKPNEIDVIIKFDEIQFAGTCYKIPIACIMYSFCFIKYKIAFILLLIISAYLLFSIFYTLKSTIKNESDTTTQ